MRVARELLDLVLPAGCVCCQRAGPWWCSDCRPVSKPELVTLARGPTTFASGDYATELRTALLAYKERGNRGLAELLSGYLSDAVDVAARSLSEHPGPPVLVPVPSNRAAARERGGDHIRRLSRLVARETSLALVPALQLTRPVADSAGLSATQRAANLAHRMRASRASPGLAGRPVVIVDDIVTTGATLVEAQRALAASGWPTAAAAAIAATRRRWPAADPTVDGPAACAVGRPRAASGEVPAGSAQIQDPFGWAEPVT